MVQRRPVVEEKVPVGSAWADTRHHEVDVLAEELLGSLDGLLVAAHCDALTPPARHIEAHLDPVGLVVVPKLPRRGRQARNH
jgi:hypothetical protein